MDAVWALVPLKPLSTGKSRLADVLSPAERARLVRHMAEDVLQALRGSRVLTGIALLGADDATAELAREFDCSLLTDDRSGDPCANLDRAAARLGREGADTVMILPADLPTLTSVDIDALVLTHDRGVTIAIAERDGGTNALLLTPPGVIGCLFGADSAARHLKAARERGVPGCALPLPAFARDIDTVDDVLWLCDQPGRGAARKYLRRSRICERLRQAQQPERAPAKA